VTKQVRRSIEMLDLALPVLREESPTDNGLLAQIAETVDQARTRLAAALGLEHREYKEAVVSGNELLEQALQRAREITGLSSRQAQSLTAVESAYAILLPVVYRSTSAYAPPVSGRALIREKSQEARAPEERRRHTRVELETDVTFDGPTNFYTGFSEDISSGGLFISTYNIRPIGTKIEVSFTMPNGHIVNARGEVRWVFNPIELDEDARPGMGVMFEELLPEDRRAVDEFIKKRAPIFYDE
jgi:uncharacterized protein (TIGR02266 family)